jgi:uncharacterized protein (UPF0276 family)
MKTIYYINAQHKNKQTYDYINKTLNDTNVHFIDDINYVYIGHILFIIGFTAGWIFYTVITSPQS